MTLPSSQPTEPPRTPRELDCYCLALRHAQAEADVAAGSAGDGRPHGWPADAACGDAARYGYRIAAHHIGQALRERERIAMEDFMRAEASEAARYAEPPRTAGPETHGPETEAMRAKLSASERIQALATAANILDAIATDARFVRPSNATLDSMADTIRDLMQDMEDAQKLAAEPLPVLYQTPAQALRSASRIFVSFARGLPTPLPGHEGLMGLAGALLAIRDGLPAHAPSPPSPRPSHVDFPMPATLPPFYEAVKECTRAARLLADIASGCVPQTAGVDPGRLFACYCTLREWLASPGSSAGQGREPPGPPCSEPEHEQDDEMARQLQAHGAPPTNANRRAVVGLVFSLLPRDIVAMACRLVAIRHLGDQAGKQLRERLASRLEQQP